MQPKYLQTQSGRKIAYHKREGKGPTIVFLGGFKSQMGGSKAIFLDSWAEQYGYAYLRMDYSGHGMSSGAFTDGCIGDWLEDAQIVLEHVTHGQLILIGSSMGGWISFLLTKIMPERIAALMAIAAAPDFTEDGFWANFSAAQKNEVLTRGITYVTSEYGDPYPITGRLVENGRKYLILRNSIKIGCPVRLLQGELDKSVSRDTALALFDRLDGEDIELSFIKGGDHSLSTTQNLAAIEHHLKHLISIVS